MPSSSSPLGCGSSTIFISAGGMSDIQYCYSLWHNQLVLLTITSAVIKYPILAKQKNSLYHLRPLLFIIVYLYLSELQGHDIPLLSSSLPILEILHRSLDTYPIPGQLHTAITSCSSIYWLYCFYH